MLSSDRCSIPTCKTSRCGRCCDASTTSSWGAGSSRTNASSCFRSHSPFAATDDSEPEPDAVVAPRIAGDWAHPTQAVLLVEVALDSLRKDRRLKLGIYAEAGVPEYWIVDIDGGQVEVNTQPNGRQYMQCERFGRSAIFQPTMLPAVAVPLAELPWDAPRH